MEGYITYYCPITKKKVKIKENILNKQIYSSSRESEYCRGIGGMCDGNCSGCRLL